MVGAFGVEHSWVVWQAQGAWLLQRALLGAQGCPVGCRIPPILLDHACCTAELLQTHFGVICWNWEFKYNIFGQCLLFWSCVLHLGDGRNSSLDCFGTVYSQDWLLYIGHELFRRFLEGTVACCVFDKC